MTFRQRTLAILEQSDFRAILQAEFDRRAITPQAVALIVHEALLAFEALGLSPNDAANRLRATLIEAIIESTCGTKPGPPS